MGLEVKLPLRRVWRLSGCLNEKPRRVDSAAGSVGVGLLMLRLSTHGYALL